MAAGGSALKSYQFKLVLLGDSAVGKSSLVLRFVKKQFFDYQESTIGAAFLTQSVQLSDALVKFEIWDTAGQERYHCPAVGTTVAKADGSIVPVESLKSGDLLLGEHGRPVSVTVDPSRAPLPLYRIATGASGHYDVTSDHHLTVSWRVNPTVAIERRAAANATQDATHLIVLRWFELDQETGFRLCTNEIPARLIQAANEAIITAATEVDMSAPATNSVSKDDDEKKSVEFAPAPIAASAERSTDIVVGTDADLRAHGRALLLQMRGVLARGAHVDVTVEKLMKQWSFLDMDGAAPYVTPALQSLQAEAGTQQAPRSDVFKGVPTQVTAEGQVVSIGVDAETEAEKRYTIVAGDHSVGMLTHNSLAPMYYRGAAAAVVVYDITNRQSFLRAKSWIKELQRQGNPAIVIALSGNKADLSDQRQVESDEARAYAEENNIFFVETSAKTNAMVNEMFKTIATKLPKGNSGPAAGKTNNIVINPEEGDAKADKKGGCC